MLLMKFLPLLVLVPAFGAALALAPAPPVTPAANSPRGVAAATAVAGKVRVVFTFAAAPVRAASRVAPVLYNKKRVLHFEEDDGPETVFSEVYPLFRGGVASNGVRYPGLRYTDGCGHTRAYTGAVDINGHNPYNNSVWLDPGPAHVPTSLLWSEAQTMLDNGWDIQNHSDLHTAPNPAQQVADLDALIASRLKGYKPTVLIVPTNYEGYPTSAFDAGYMSVSSASQGDNFTMLNLYNETRVDLSILPVPPARFVYRRYSADANYGESNWQLLNRLKLLSDALMEPGNSPDDVYLQRVFTHFIDFNVLADWMSYTQSIANDQLWVTSLREFDEYRRVRNQVVKSENLGGNTLTVDLDYAALSPNTRFQNLTLLVDSPGTLTGVSVAGADSSSFYLASKMVNIYRRQEAQPPTPLPVVLTSFAARRVAEQVHVAWQTASEVQARHFAVQRSSDGRAYTELGTVAAAGTSAAPHDYQFRDATAPARQDWYYRLAQVDFDGKTTYGPVAMVAGSAAPAPQVHVAPNPATAAEGLRLTLEGCQGRPLVLDVLDNLGQVVAHQALRPTSTQESVVLRLPATVAAGAYVLRVLGAGRPLRTRVLLTQ